jgi:hypothetical protein
MIFCNSYPCLFQKVLFTLLIVLSRVFSSLLVVLNANISVHWTYIAGRVLAVRVMKIFVDSIFYQFLLAQTTFQFIYTGPKQGLSLAVL